jgi:hypothetical protein
MRNYSVWVGGGEVNDFLLDRIEAESLALNWIEQGYEDVYIWKVEA